MLHLEAAGRRERRQRLDHIADLIAAERGGDFAKKLIATLKS